MSHPKYATAAHQVETWLWKKLPAENPNVLDKAWSYLMAYSEVAAEDSAASWVRDVADIHQSEHITFADFYEVLGVTMVNSTVYYCRDVDLFRMMLSWGRVHIMPLGFWEGKSVQNSSCIFTSS